MRKKILKYVSFLVAIIIAFSCFCIPASAQDIPSVGAFQVNNFDFFVAYAIYDSSGEVVDQVVITPDTYNYNVSGDSLYIDISDSKLDILMKPGYLVAFNLSWYYPDELPTKLVYFTFPESYSFLEYFDNFDSDSFDSNSCFSTNISNCHFTSTDYNSSFGVGLFATENSKYFPLVVTVTDNPKDDTAFTAPDVYPGMFKFYLVICSVADFILDCLLKIISCVCNNPLLCLGIAMWCIGGAIGFFKRLV